MLRARLDAGLRCHLGISAFQIASASVSVLFHATAAYTSDYTLEHLSNQFCHRISEAGAIRRHPDDANRGARPNV